VPLSTVLYKEDGTQPFTLLREYDDWGLRAVDIVGPPRRFWADQSSIEPPVEVGLEATRVRSSPTPAALLDNLPSTDNWQAMSRRSIARLQAYFLICEDPQRRMDARDVETLSHQVSLVRHILQNQNLRRVMIADEVGLGKTVEAGLIVKELLEQRPELRVLYLAPARLVSNVRAEFDRLGLPFRQWSATESDARLTDPRVIASLHRAVHGENAVKVLSTAPWDIIVVDECHHLSAWEQDGGKPSQAYRLVQQLLERQSSEARVILMSGTPHQGHHTRFENLLRLLRGNSESDECLSGRVIYRTKDDIRNWEGAPVFPNRQVNEPLIVDLGESHRDWLRAIHDFYTSPRESAVGEARRRAAGWRCSQAMQWAASSPNAGVGYLTRQAIRANWGLDVPILRESLGELRPYRLGPPDESVESLYRRIVAEVDRQNRDDDIEDIEEFIPGDARDVFSARGLERLLEQGLSLLRRSGDEKWMILQSRLLEPAGDEKVVLFAQPIETVTALSRFLERQTGHKPAIIIGGQDDLQRKQQVEAFRALTGPQYLISSRAGGEGINLQVARRLIHIDVPWNPMDMEQRVGRVHRFGSKETIIVDTMVVQDSREADAFRIAREKLRLITRTLVEPERFEAVFSRVMCLLSQDELQDILMSNPTAPLSSLDQQRLSEMVQHGFQHWKQFHDRFGEQQKSIEQQSAGLLTWADVLAFFEQFGGAVRKPGHTVGRFQRNGNSVRHLEEDADVIAIGNASFACGEYGEALVAGPDGQMTMKFGLNRPEAAGALRRAALPGQPTGAAWLRWPPATPVPPGIKSAPFFLLVLSRQTLKRDATGSWTEQGATLHACLHDGSDTEVTEVAEHTRGMLLRTIPKATIRKNVDGSIVGLTRVKAIESELVDRLRRPTEEEVRTGIRYAVTPLFCGVFTD
jgi:superfamily II DNA or RNA helicase